MTNRKTSLFTEYPIPFVQNGDDRIKDTLAAHGFRHGLNRTRDVRDWLVGHNLLFALHQPVWKVQHPNRAFLHPAYMDTALDGSPNITLPPFNRQSDKWLPAAAEHLSHFAEQPEASRLIIDGLTKYYSHIAQATTFPNGSSHPYLAARPEKGQTIAPLNYMGVSDRSALKFDFRPELDDEENEYERFRDEGMGSHFQDGRKSLRQVRMYVPVRALARSIMWRIPGIESEETRAAIVDGFTAQDGPHMAVSPTELFMLGQVALAEDTDQPVRAVRDIFGIE